MRFNTPIINIAFSQISSANHLKVNRLTTFDSYRYQTLLYSSQSTNIQCVRNFSIFNRKSIQVSLMNPFTYINVNISYNFVEIESREKTEKLLNNLNHWHHRKIPMLWRFIWNLNRLLIHNNLNSKDVLKIKTKTKNPKRPLHHASYSCSMCSQFLPWLKLLGDSIVITNILNENVVEIGSWYHLLHNFVWCIFVHLAIADGKQKSDLMWNTVYRWIVHNRRISMSSRLLNIKQTKTSKRQNSIIWITSITKFECL